MMRGDFVTILLQDDFGKPKAVKLDKVGPAIGRIDADAMIDLLSAVLTEEPVARSPTHVRTQEQA